MQPAALTKAQRPALAQGLGARRRVGGRRSAAPVRAVAISEDTTDIGALLRDALAMPAAKEPAGPPAAAPPAPVAPPPPAPLAAPAPPPVPEAAAPPASVTVDPVPGVEILSGTPPPQPAPAATQGMDFVLQQLQDKPPGYGAGTAKAAKAATAPLADGLGDAAKGLGDGLASAGRGLGDAGAAAGKGLSGAADSVGDALGGAASALSGAAGALTGAGKSLGGGAAGAADAAAGASAAAAAAAAQAADALSSTLAGAAGGAASSAQSFVGAALEEFNTEAGIIRSNLDQLAGGVGGALGGTTSALSAAVGGQVSGAAAVLSGAAERAAGLLPPELQSALYTAGGAVAGVARQAAGLVGGVEPSVGAVAAGLGLGLPAVLAWKAAFGGFAGSLTPEEAAEVLQSEDALLLDIRTEQQRLDKGVAELRRGALGKGVAVPPVQLLPSLARRVRDSAAVSLEIQALEVAALSKVAASSTKVIVMDASGESAKRMARALRAAGVRRPYVLAGGFRAWTGAGLAVRQGASEYGASPLDAVEDIAGSVVEQAGGRLSALRQPGNAAVAAAALGGLGFLAGNYHTALQFVGVLGLELTLVSRALSYGSVDEAVEDLRTLYSSAAALAALPAKVAGSLGRPGGGAQQAAGDGKL